MAIPTPGRRSAARSISWRRQPVTLTTWTICWTWYWTWRPQGRRSRTLRLPNWAASRRAFTVRAAAAAAASAPLRTVPSPWHPPQRSSAGPRAHRCSRMRRHLCASPSSFHHLMPVGTLPSDSRSLFPVFLQLVSLPQATIHAAWCWHSRVQAWGGPRTLTALLAWWYRRMQLSMLHPRAVRSPKLWDLHTSSVSTVGSSGRAARRPRRAGCKSSPTSES
mmetsp:Transcript_81618/g.226071  ORF Transcript_81618/g.226071 Transcript_81618/m.226071 type:complete len:220 (-) Transcript_81618:703-1362(-)